MFSLHFSKEYFLRKLKKLIIKDNIAYAKDQTDNLKIKDFKILDKLYMLVLFNTGEQRVFDCAELLQYPVFKELEDEVVFNTAKIRNGVLTWKNGEIDLGIHTVYQMSYEYQHEYTQKQIMN
jgi:hypothetical protein